MIDPKVTQAVTSQVQRAIADATRESMSPLNAHTRRQIADILQSNRVVTRYVVDPAVFTGIPSEMQAQLANIAKAASPAVERIRQQMADLANIVLPTAYVPKVALPTLDLPIPDAMRSILESFREHLPPNWPAGVDLDRVVEIVSTDGLPLVWVPRAEIVLKILDAETRDDRVAILLDHVPELVEDCQDVLNGLADDELIGQRQLAQGAVEALGEGHYEAAQALSVVVAETAISRSISGSYREVRTQVTFDPELVSFTLLRLHTALAPIVRFYTPWRPEWPQPAPEALSRHVTAHQADPDHFTRGNGVIAVLLVCSVLRALQELHELDARHDAA